MSSIWRPLPNHLCNGRNLQLYYLALNILYCFAGTGPTVAQDSFMYRMEHGIASILIDDDNCDCQSSLSLGHGMCYSTFDPKFGPAGRYGVDLLSDTGCHTPSPVNGLTLYFKGRKLRYHTFKVSHFARKPVLGVSDQIRHKPVCTATEDG